LSKNDKFSRFKWVVFWISYIKSLLQSCSSKRMGKEVILLDPEYYRPTEVDLLIGDPTKSKTQLGWKPQYDLAAMVKEMVASDWEILKRQK
jgi:GDPmannose 4,6-dehydratase